jgi:hypothetical protein
MEALDDSRNCQTLGVSPAELGAYELLVKCRTKLNENGYTLYYDRYDDEWRVFTKSSGLSSGFWSLFGDSLVKRCSSLQEVEVFVNSLK